MSRWVVGTLGIVALLLGELALSGDPLQRTEQEQMPLRKAWKVTLPQEKSSGWIHVLHDPSSETFELAFDLAERGNGRIQLRLKHVPGCFDGEVTLRFPVLWWLRESNCLRAGGRPYPLDSTGDWASLLEQPGIALESELETSHGQNYFWFILSDELLELRNRGDQKGVELLLRERSGLAEDPLRLPKEVAPLWSAIAALVAALPDRATGRIFSSAVESLEEYFAPQPVSPQTSSEAQLKLEFHEVSAQDPAVEKLLRRVESVALKDPEKKTSSTEPARLKIDKTPYR